MLWLRYAMALILVGAGVVVGPAAFAAGEAPGAPGGGSSWTTGAKIAIGTATGTASKVWYTAAGGITTEVFYPRADVPDVQDLQYVVTDGSSFVDLERDATTHTVTMPDENAPEYTVTNTARSGRYRITNTYVTDPARSTLLIRTRFQSLDGGGYRLFALFNPSLAGGAGGDTGGWDATRGAMVASDTGSLPVASALVASTGFTAHSTGYSGTDSDGYRDIAAHHALANPYDTASSGGNIVQTVQVPVGADTTFTLALGFGASRDEAAATAAASLGTGFGPAESGYRAGWDGYLGGLTVPASVSGDAVRRRAYKVGLIALHTSEDKTFPGANVAALATPWGDAVDGNALSDGYHRVWARDLYQQATTLLAAGDRAQATRMARWLWDRQQITGWTQGDGIWYGPGSFPRYSPVSGTAGATPAQLGCCEQLDQDAFPIVLADQLGLTDAGTWSKVKLTADHIAAIGPDTPSERWEEQPGKSPSTIAAEIAGLVCAADLARRNGDTASAGRYEATADSWRDQLDGWTFTTTGYFGDHRYYERVEHDTNPNDTYARTFGDGTWWERDIVDGGFLDLVRLGVRPASYGPVVESLGELDAVDEVGTPVGAMWHRYNHDSYGESQADGTGWPSGHASRTGRLWPLLSGERGEYELAAGHPATAYLQTMAGAADAGYLIPEQVWDRPDQFGFTFGQATGSAAPLNWAEAQYVRLALALDSGHPVETPAAVRARYGT
ncbi:MAG: glucan 1,4-alpha-glucosidase [Actinobacteria bacterium 13_1_20CM_3_71_11]|nr:MAG: glucan 1,4-alpha-glucosidase [Actinobacteria bacterium 13_1_20CM_3_71_11]